MEDSRAPEFHRVQALRRLQRAHGHCLDSLTPEQLGEIRPHMMHHVMAVTSKSGAIRYRVRVCKTCSQSHVIELGSFSDEESAILVNDCHEILHRRTRKLHCLIPSDESFFNQIYVARRIVRGDMPETPVLLVLQEHEIKRASQASKYTTTNEQKNSSVLVQQRHHHHQSSPLITCHRSLLPGVSQSIPFVGDCCSSIAQFLVGYGVAASVDDCRSSLRSLVACVILPTSRSRNVLVNVPITVLAFLRFVISGYIPDIGPSAMRELMDPLERAAEYKWQWLREEKEIKQLIDDIERCVGFICIPLITVSLRRYALFASAVVCIKNHNLKFPAYMWDSEVDAQSFHTRMVLLKDTTTWAIDRIRFVLDTLEQLEFFVLNSSPLHDHGSFQQAYNSFCQAACLLLGVALTASATLCGLKGESDTLAMIADLYPVFHIYSKQILSAEQQTIQRAFELNVLVSLSQCNKLEDDETSQHTLVSRMAVCYIAVSQMVRVMPSYNEKPVTFNPTIPAPALAASIFQQEFGVMMVGTVCSCLIHAPEVYRMAYPDKTLLNLQQEFPILLRLLWCCLSALSEFIQNMNCGLSAGVLIPVFYMIGRDMRRIPSFMAGDADTARLMRQLLYSARQILAVLGARFLIARDLLDLLDRLGEEQSQDLVNAVKSTFAPELLRFLP